MDARELSERVVLAYTGAPRQSGINNWEVMKAHINGDRRVHRNFDEITSIARGMVDALEKADWGEAGRLLREEWAHRRRNSPGITTPLIDRLVGLRAPQRSAGRQGVRRRRRRVRGVPGGEGLHASESPRPSPRRAAG